MLKLFLIAILCVLTNFSDGQQLRSDFFDILDVKQKVVRINDVSQTFFCDLGAWHGYSLPKDTADYGAFIGPVVMDLSGYWISNTLTKLRVSIDGKSVDLANSEVVQHYYPGLLYQELKVHDLIIVQRLIFQNERTALIENTITNTGACEKVVQIDYVGEILVPAQIIADSNQIDIFPSGKDHALRTIFSGDGKASAEGNQTRYSLTAKLLRKDDTIKTIISQAYFVSKTEIQKYQTHSAIVFPTNQQQATNINVDFEQALELNELRWNSYLNSFFKSAPDLSFEEKKVAVKSIITLITNWKSAAKDLLHDGVFPSVNYQGFYGFWSWDSWKQAVGLMYFQHDLAKNNIRAMFDFIDAEGMIADCVYTDRNENNGRDTKPPLAGWAVWNVVTHSGDAGFAAEMYPKLVRYHQWWYENRDNDNDGICEYGSTDGTRIAAAWESGMDNAVRFDSSKLIRIKDHAWSLNQESVDLNAFLYAEKIYLAKLARLIGKTTEANLLDRDSKNLKQRINNLFFDSENGYYYDRLHNDVLIRVDGPEGWLPLWAGVSTTKQARHVIVKMKESKKFNTHVPLPTLAADHKAFDPLDGYWRGPVWVDQLYFGIAGLRRYGETQLADELTDRFMKNASGIYGDQPICENYHPLTGECLNARNFSWSAAHILMLLVKIKPE